MVLPEQVANRDVVFRDRELQGSFFCCVVWEIGCGDYHHAKCGNVMTGQGHKELEKSRHSRAQLQIPLCLARR